MAITLEKFKQGPKTAVEKLNKIVDELERLKKEVRKARGEVGERIDVIIADNGLLRNAVVFGELGDFIDT